MANELTINTADGPAVVFNELDEVSVIVQIENQLRCIAARITTNDAEKIVDYLNTFLGRGRIDYDQISEDEGFIIINQTKCKIENGIFTHLWCGISSKEPFDVINKFCDTCFIYCEEEI